MDDDKVKENNLTRNSVKKLSKKEPMEVMDKKRFKEVDEIIAKEHIFEPKRMFKNLTIILVLKM